MLGILIGILRYLGVVLHASGLAELWLRLFPAEDVTLLYHDLGSERISADAFRRQMLFVKKTFPRATVTFDDGYRSAATIAAPILKETGIPATVFLCSDTKGNGAMLWPDELAWHWRQDPDAVREASGMRVRALDPLVQNLINRATRHFIGALLDRLALEAGIDRSELARSQRLYLDEAEIDLLARQGVNVGGHGTGHWNLLLLNDEELAAEFAGNQEVFAYPFGLHDERVRLAARRAGYRQGFEVGYPWTSTDPFRVPRVEVKHPGVGRLFAEVAVVRPVVQALRASFNASAARIPTLAN